MLCVNPHVLNIYVRTRLKLNFKCWFSLSNLFDVTNDSYLQHWEGFFAENYSDSWTLFCVWRLLLWVLLACPAWEMFYSDRHRDTFHVKKSLRRRTGALFWINTYLTEPAWVKALLYSITLIGRSLGVQTSCHSPPRFPPWCLQIMENIHFAKKHKKKC